MDGGRMGRIGSVLLACSLVVGLAVAPGSAFAKKKKKKVERTAQADYVLAVGPRGTADTPCIQAPVGCVRIPVEKGDKFVSVEIVDAAGQPVYASVYVYGYSDGSDGHEHICGATNAPLPLAPGLEELVITTAQTTGGATSPCLGPVTSGTITATFTNLP